jgi:hypothetical protein
MPARFGALPNVEGNLANPAMGIGQHESDHVRRQMYSVTVLGQNRGKGSEEIPGHVNGVGRAGELIGTPFHVLDGRDIHEGDRASPAGAQVKIVVFAGMAQFLTEAADLLETLAPQEHRRRVD